MDSKFLYDMQGRNNFGFGLMGTMFPIFFTLIFVLIFGAIIYSIITAAKQGHKNNMSPVLIVEAVVISKRTNVSHHHHSNMTDNNMNNNFTESSSSTSYYTTFQVESGDRIEFHVKGSEYGLMVEGDVGKLKFQGTRFLDFTRI